MTDINLQIPTGNVDTTTYQMTNLKMGYVQYAKAGKLWSVDTTTLEKKQVSNETMFTGSNLCAVTGLVDWNNPDNSTLTYILKGTDGWCWTPDDERKAVKRTMTAADAPINIGPRELGALLFDGTYIAFNASTSKVEICQPNLTTCSAKASYLDYAWAKDYDAKRVVFLSDGKLKIYDYTTNKMTLLYTPGPDDSVINVSLDRDGFVYFSTVSFLPPYTYAIYKVPVGEAV